LWQPGPNQVPLGHPYQINDAFGNAWKVARPQLSPDPFKEKPDDRAFIKSVVLNLPPQPSGCVLSVFDQWILDTIIAIRNRSLMLAGGNAPAQPYALSTVGMAQKILNVYLKYQACWHVGGQWDQATGQFVNHPASARVDPFLCALHCPIDSVLLKTLLQDPIGQELIKHGLMNNQGHLRQSNGDFDSWSKLDCLETYFAFQWILRNFAMRTWLPGCACQSIVSRKANSVAGSSSPSQMPGLDEIWSWFRKVVELWGDHKHAKIVKKRKIVIKREGLYYSIKWRCCDYNNAGALSFKGKGFSGDCYLNSTKQHSGGDRALWEEIELMGSDFQKTPGFSQAPKSGGVNGLGGGKGYLGYRTFRSLSEAETYLLEFFTIEKLF
jgi:hypothetical protein